MNAAGIIEAMRADLPPATRLVWVCLEIHAVDHVCTMSRAEIAETLHLGIRTVNRAVNELRDASIIVCRYGGKFEITIGNFSKVRMNGAAGAVWTFGDDQGGTP